MAYKKVPHDTKVNALKEALTLKDIGNIADKYGISQDTIKNDFDKLVKVIDETIKDKKPGPKIKVETKIDNVIPINKYALKKAKETTGMRCPKCAGENVVKNGTYTVVNWLLRMVVLLLPFLKINIESKIQKYLCTDCASPVHGKDKEYNQYIREAIRLQIIKLICLLRFKESLSIRAISQIIKSIYGVGGSIGHIVGVCKKVSKNAHEKLQFINHCTQKEAKMMITDETFPKTKTSGTTNLGVVVDENGLIRGIKVILKKKRIWKNFTEQ